MYLFLNIGAETVQKGSMNATGVHFLENALVIQVQTVQGILSKLYRCVSNSTHIGVLF